MEELPQGYSRTGEETISRDKREVLRFYAIAFFAVGLINIVENKLFGGSVDILLLLMTTISVVVLHELAHFVSARISGLHPRFTIAKVPGFGYCPGVILNGGFFSRKDYIACLLAPQVLTVLCVLWLNLISLNEYVFVFMACNLLGGMMDMKSTFYVLTKHQPETIYRHESVTTTGVYTKGTVVPTSNLI